MLRSLRIAGIGPHTDTRLDIPPGRVEFSGPSEAGKTSITAAICALLWGTRTDGKPLAAGRSVAVKAETTKGTEIYRARSASGTASMSLGGQVFDTQRDFTAALKALGDVDKLRPLLVPFGWVGLLQGPGEGRPLREWLVEHLPGESLDSALEGIRPGEADGKDHAARLKEAAARVTRANKGVSRAEGMLEEAQAAQPEPPTAPDPARVAELQALSARHAEQTQAQADARAAVKAWQAATVARRNALDALRVWEGRKADIVTPRAERPAHEALTAAADAKIRAADAEATARRAKADVDAKVADASRKIEAANRAQRDLGDPPQPGSCSGVKKGCRLAADADKAAERWQEQADSYSAQRAAATAQHDEAAAALPAAVAAVETATKATSEARAAYLKLQDAELAWRKYDEALAKLGPAPVVPEDPRPQPQIPEVDPLPEDADAVLQYEAAAAYHRRDMVAREERIRDLRAALDQERARAERAAWVLATLRAAPSRVLGARLAGLAMGPSALVLGDDGESIDWHIDGRPWGDASHGRQVVADAWVRRALADACGAKWLPVIVDEVESVNGAAQALPGGLLWLLRSTPTAGLAVRALES